MLRPSSTSFMESSSSSSTTTTTTSVAVSHPQRQVSSVLSGYGFYNDSVSSNARIPPISSFFFNRLITANSEGGPLTFPSLQVLQFIDAASVMPLALLLCVSLFVCLFVILGLVCLRLLLLNQQRLFLEFARLINSEELKLCSCNRLFPTVALKSIQPTLSVGTHSVCVASASSSSISGFVPSFGDFNHHINIRVIHGKSGRISVSICI